MCAFRAIGRDALTALGMREMTYGWNIEMQMKAAQQRLRILEVPMPYRRRAGGTSKVAGSFAGTLRAGSKIISTSCESCCRTAPLNVKGLVAGLESNARIALGNVHFALGMPSALAGERASSGRPAWNART